MEAVIKSTLLSILEPINEQNINPTHKAVVRTNTDDEVIVYCKELPPREIFVECAIALLGRDLGISIPKPYIILATPDIYPNITENTLLFGSENIDYPNLFRKLNKDIDRSLINAMLSEYDQQFGIIAFDEWTANPDRHFGNILYGGNNKFYFIDHEFCTPIGYNPNQMIGKNRLLEHLELTKNTDKFKLDYLNQCMLKHTHQYSNPELCNFSERTFAVEFLPKNDIEYLENFLKNRIIHVTDLLNQRLAIQQQTLFSGVMH